MYKDVFESWLISNKLSKQEIKELSSINDEKELEYRFGKDLEFGTAGMRGIIGLGTNMMNRFTVMRATQGLAEYVKSLGIKEMNRGVVISYDTRRCSAEFAMQSAIVLASNGIKTYLFDDVHPVPMLSYAVRELKTIAGIMITASHNPKEYNGYKVYGEDGAQMSPEATAIVVDFINKIDCMSDQIRYEEKFINKVNKVKHALDKKYYKTLLKLSLSNAEVKKVGKTIKLVYTPIHGSGYIPVTKVLKKMGIHAILVPEQLNKDTEFSTVKVPNPEFKETLSLGIKLADLKNADIVFGTDPDCDRLGVAIRDNQGEFQALSGNQVGCLLLDYILLRLKQQGRLSKKTFAVKSFVSTDLAKLIAKEYNVELMETPVGFKFIGEKIKQYDDQGNREFLFGFEESCGYLRGTHCRDKDAVVASMLFAEMVCYYNYIGVSVYEKLCELYEKHGYFFDTNVSVNYSGLNAMAEMNEVVEKMKSIRLESIGGIKVVAVRDYSKAKCYFSDGKEVDIDCAKVNAVYYQLEKGFVCIRPSGTEPKLKIYYSLSCENKELAEKIFKHIKADFESLM